MARKATLSEIRTFLTELGLGRNPIEKITHHKDGSVTIWVTGLAEPVKMQAPGVPHPPPPSLSSGRGGARDDS